MGIRAASRVWVGLVITAAIGAALGLLAWQALGALIGLIVFGVLYLLITWDPVWHWLPIHRFAERRRHRRSEVERFDADEEHRQRLAARCPAPENGYRHRWCQGLLRDTVRSAG
jgi:fatty acid desaturase